MADKSNFLGHKNPIGTNTKGTRFYLTRATEGHCPMRTVVAEPAQQLPEELRGGFTDTASAIRAFEEYMARVNRKPKGQKDVADSED